MATNPSRDVNILNVALGIVWSDMTLNRWLTDPESLIPGQRMNFRVQLPEDRADIIAFLKRESGK